MNEINEGKLKDLLVLDDYSAMSEVNISCS